MSDITDPSTVAFNSNGFGSALDKIKAFNFDTKNPKALFDEIMQTLKTLSGLQLFVEVADRFVNSS